MESVADDDARDERLPRELFCAVVELIKSNVSTVCRTPDTTSIDMFDALANYARWQLRVCRWVRGPPGQQAAARTFVLTWAMRFAAMQTAEAVPRMIRLKALFPPHWVVALRTWNVTNIVNGGGDTGYLTMDTPTAWEYLVTLFEASLKHVLPRVCSVHTYADNPTRTHAELDDVTDTFNALVFYNHFSLVLSEAEVSMHDRIDSVMANPTRPCGLFQ